MHARELSSIEVKTYQFTSAVSLEHVTAVSFDTTLAVELSRQLRHYTSSQRSLTTTSFLFRDALGQIARRKERGLTYDEIEALPNFVQTTTHKSWITLIARVSVSIMQR